MSTVRVLKGFRDIVEHVDRRPGESFEASDERAAEIASRIPGYVEVVPGEDASQDYSKLTKAELVRLLGERGIPLPKRQNKADLIALLGG